jgi:hypothetical protein
MCVAGSTLTALRRLEGTSGNKQCSMEATWGSRARWTRTLSVSALSGYICLFFFCDAVNRHGCLLTTFEGRFSIYGVYT